MALLYIKRYSRDFIQAHPDWLFVFGDNLERRGLGGQAKEARGEPNAVGIPTKRKPNNDDDAFLTDADYHEWAGIAGGDMSRIRRAHKLGRVVVWPLDGIGTGLAKLSQDSKIRRSIQQFQESLEVLYG